MPHLQQISKIFYMQSHINMITHSLCCWHWWGQANNLLIVFQVCETKGSSQAQTRMAQFHIQRRNHYAISKPPPPLLWGKEILRPVYFHWKRQKGNLFKIMLPSLESTEILWSITEEVTPYMLMCLVYPH